MRRRHSRTKQSAEKCPIRAALYQGTTSVVPQVQKIRRALTPEVPGSASHHEIERFSAACNVRGRPRFTTSRERTPHPRLARGGERCFFHLRLRRSHGGVIVLLFQIVIEDARQFCCLGPVGRSA